MTYVFAIALIVALGGWWFEAGQRVEAEKTIDKLRARVLGLVIREYTRHPDVFDRGES